MSLSIFEKRVGHQEARKMLGISSRTLYEKVRTGAIPAYRSGDANHHFVYRVDDLQRYLDQFQPVAPKARAIASSSLEA